MGAALRPGEIYHVQVGSFSKKAPAEKKMQAVKDAGFEDAFLACVDDKLWRVLVGNYADKADAERRHRELVAKGFSGYVTTLGGEIEATK